jgi:Icc-related predicted phosphoesterase
MPKKKRLIMIVAVLLAVLAGSQYGYLLTLFCIVLMVALLGGLRWFRYALAHAGIDQLTRHGGRYHMSRLIERLKAGEQADRPFRFVVLGDNRNARKFPRVIHHHVKEENPAFMFNTGDLVRFGTAREFVTRYVPLLEIMDPVPVLSVPGNHDRGARNDFAAYLALLGEERFSFDYGPCRFVGVNNAKRARMKEDDIAYLGQELSKSPIQYKFVFIHIPPPFFEDKIVTVKKRRGFKKLASEFRALMTQQHVNEVFMGHIHGYASHEIDGVRYTLTAGAGAPLSKRLTDDAQVHNYVVIDVDENGLKREVVRCINDTWIRGT